MVSLWHVDIWPPTLPKHISPWRQRSAHVVAIAIRATHQNNGQQSRWPWAAMNQTSKTVGWVVMFLYRKIHDMQVDKDRYLKCWTFRMIVKSMFFLLDPPSFQLNLLIYSISFGLQMWRENKVEVNIRSHSESSNNASSWTECQHILFDPIIYQYNAVSTMSLSHKPA